MTTHHAKLATTTPYWADVGHVSAVCQARRGPGDRRRRGGCRNDRPQRGVSAGEGRQAGRRARARPLRETDTGHTSAHLTMVTDTRVTELVTRFGRNHAQAVWDAGLAAIATIDEIVREHAIDAGFEWVDGYLHAPLNGADAEQEPERCGTMRRSPASWGSTRSTSRPCRSSTGRAFVSRIRRAFTRAATWRVSPGPLSQREAASTSTAADEFCDDPRAVKVAGYTVHCEDIVIATHNPLVGLAGLAGATLFQTKLALYTSYVIAGRCRVARWPTRCGGTPAIRTISSASSRSGTSTW